MIKQKTAIALLFVSAICTAGVANDEKVSKYIELANAKVNESYAISLENGPKQNNRQIEGENTSSKKKIHLSEVRNEIYLDSATFYLDSALKISRNRADVWIGKTQIGAFYSSCKYQTQAFESLIKHFKAHPNEMIFHDGSKVASIDDLVKKEFMYALNRRWEKQEDSCNLELSHLLVNTYPDYVPGLNALASIQGIFANDSSWQNFEKAIRLNPKDNLVVNNYLNQLISAKKCDTAQAKYNVFRKSGITFEHAILQRMKTCDTDE